MGNAKNTMSMGTVGLEVYVFESSSNITWVVNTARVRVHETPTDTSRAREHSTYKPQDLQVNETLYIFTELRRLYKKYLQSTW
jgi:type IV secretory pathway VirB9-like protein